MNEEILIPIAFTAATFGILYVYFNTRHKERMLMIEKGVDASLVHTKPVRYHTLKFGIFLIGIAAGVLFGNILDAYTSLEEGTSYVSMIFLFGGLSLVIYHVMEKKKEA
jgi:ABC-type Fe3+-siderophore transport system permease subunit